MPGTKGKSGGRREGSGRPPVPNPKGPKRYIRPVVQAPSNLLEQRAVEWYLSLDPKTRLESVVEDFTFQTAHLDYLIEIGEIAADEINE